LDQIDVEAEFIKFIRNFGGTVLEDVLSKSPNFSNADFIFDADNIVAELKILKDNKKDDFKIQEKVQSLFDEWVENGVIEPIYGEKVTIDSKNLPEKCQIKLLDVYKPHIQRRIIKANKQIKKTIEKLKFDKGRGLLILVNDGNYALESEAVLYLVRRILGKSFRFINTIIYCTVNMFANSNITEKATLVWVKATRDQFPCISDEFTTKLFYSWVDHLKLTTGKDIEVILLDDSSKEINNMKYKI